MQLNMKGASATLVISYVFVSKIMISFMSSSRPEPPAINISELLMAHTAVECLAVKIFETIFCHSGAAATVSKTSIEARSVEPSFPPKTKTRLPSVVEL